MRSFCLACSHRLAPRDLIPLGIALPIIIYSWAFGTVVVNQHRADEIRTREIYMRSVSRKLDAVSRADTAVCRDYAHSSELHAAMPNVPRTWLDMNMTRGIGSYAGFSVALLQHADGAIVWSKGLSRRGLEDLKAYGILKDCMRHDTRNGLIRLDGPVYIFSACGIRNTQHSGRPRGMLLVGRQINDAFLQSLMEMAGHKLIFIQPGHHPANASHVLSEELRARAAQLLSRNTQSNRPCVWVSKDQTTSYACLRTVDVAGHTSGLLVDAASRASACASLQAIRRMALALALLCLVIGIGGTVYMRTRELARSAHLDHLTGLYNHGHLQEHLQIEVLRAARYQCPLSVLMLDIDHFKMVNDSYGHSAGDRVLRAIADLIRTSVRETDIPARYGGEEFVVVLPQTDEGSALVAAERLRTAVGSCAFKHGASGVEASLPSELRLTISIGIASHPEDGHTAADLLQAADIALTWAKRQRNKMVAHRDVVIEQGGEARVSSQAEAFLRDPALASVRALVSAIDMRNPGSTRHSEKTANLAFMIGRAMHLSTQELNTLCRAALLHDVGMLGVSDSLLTKADGLNPEELETVKRHSKLGADIIASSPQLTNVAEIVLCHHENYDGTGYPQGLSGENIPRLSRVLAVASAIDAMTSMRSYRRAMSIAQVMAELENKAGKQFDPEPVRAALAVLRRMSEAGDGQSLAA